MLRLHALVAVAAIVHATFAFFVAGHVLRWVPNTDFDNPRNWKSGRIPCQNEHVRFPPSVSSVLVQRNNTVLEIILPNDGEIILGPDVSLQFSTSSSNEVTCPERENIFNGSTAMSWYDPDNWCEVADIDSNHCSEDRSRLLHTESIPCSYDDVIFPLPKRFVVDVASAAEISVNSFHIGTEQLTQRALRQFLSTEAGRKQFVRRPPGPDTTFKVTAQGACNDVSGCVCYNDKLKDKICEVQTTRCPQPACKNALEPRGHCCSICGALLELDISSTFRMQTLDNVLKNLYQPPVTKRSTRGENVYWIVSKIYTGIETIIQVVIADNGDGENAVKVAYMLKEDVQKDMKGRRRYGITNIEMRVSGTVGPEAHGHTGEETSSNVTNIIVPIVVILIILVAAGLMTWYLISRRRGTGMTLPSVVIPSFARWRSGNDGTPSRGDMELGRRGVVFDNKTLYDDANTAGFENIGFGNVLSLQQFDQLEVQPMDGPRDSYANPLYGGEPGVREIISQSSSRRPHADIDDVTNESGARQQSTAAAVSFSSRVAGVFKGLRVDSNSGRQRFENEDDDENGNVKSEPDETTENRQEVDRNEGGKDVKSTGEARTEKKKRFKKSKADKHQRLDEDSEDTEVNEEQSTRKSTKQPTVTKDKGISNPCYDIEPSTASAAAPSSTQAPEFYQARRGFNNPVFEEPNRRIDGAEPGESEA